MKGLHKGPSGKQIKPEGKYGTGLFVHKHGTYNKVWNYMVYMPFAGFLVCVLLKCRIASWTDRIACQPDQWCVKDPAKVSMHTVYIHMVRFDNFVSGECYAFKGWRPDM